MFGVADFSVGQSRESRETFGETENRKASWSRISDRLGRMDGTQF